MVYKRQISE